MILLVTLISVLIRATAVGRIAVVKPEKAEQVEMMVLQLAQQGKIREKVAAQSAFNPGHPSQNARVPWP